MTEPITLQNRILTIVFLNFFRIYFVGIIDLLGFNTQKMNIGFPLWFSLNLIHHYFASTSDDIILNWVKILSISLILEHRKSPCKEPIKEPKFLALIFLYSTLLTAIPRQWLTFTQNWLLLHCIKTHCLTWREWWLLKHLHYMDMSFISNAFWQRSAKHTYTTGCFVCLHLTQSQNCGSWKDLQKSLSLNPLLKQVPYSR